MRGQLEFEYEWSSDQLDATVAEHYDDQPLREWTDWWWSTTASKEASAARTGIRVLDLLQVGQSKGSYVDSTKADLRFGYSLWAPYWLLIGLVSLPALVVARRHSRRHRRAAGRCPACGYDLRATPQRCPECGAIVAQRETPSATIPPKEPRRDETN